jgi:mono/diheme cytochrome c family protein
VKRCLISLAAVFVFLLLVGGVVAFQFNLSAIQEPGRVETFLATKGKRWLIRRASQKEIPPPPADRQSSIEEGDKLFGTECAACHGLDGHKLTDAGRWMYPRAADLISPAVQQYSDRELFWIVKNGIRLSGMPAFGRVESDEHIWNLVHYVKTLQRSPEAIQHKQIQDGRIAECKPTRFIQAHEPADMCSPVPAQRLPRLLGSVG